MRPFGHVGIAGATTIAAFVSLWQYYRGLKKRGYWNCPQKLLIKIGKIIFCSIIMSMCLLFAEYFVNLKFNDWLSLGILPRLAIFGFLCILGVASFLITAKLTNVLDIKEIMSVLLKKGNRKCSKTPAK